MRKSLILFAFAGFALFSCKTEKEWAQNEQREYMNDCITTDPGVPNIEAICQCGLRKAMEKYPTRLVAQKEIRNMTSAQMEAMFEECMHPLGEPTHDHPH